MKSGHSDLPNVSSSNLSRSFETNTRVFSAEEVKRKNSTGSWLSPLEQPQARAGTVNAPPLPPQDPKHRKYVGTAALNLSQLVEENKTFFGETSTDAFKSFPLIPQVSSRKQAAGPAVAHSTEHAPLSITHKIFPESAFVSLSFDKGGQPRSGSVRYSWIEQGQVRHGKNELKRTFTVQVRHHTKLENFHEVHRPVYCINLKTDYGEPLDLRMIAIVHTEIQFLEAAARHFSRAGDSFGGFPVFDHHGRTLVDERVVRRAAYRYAEYQRTVNNESLYRNDGISNELRYAHFLVMRSHLPEFHYDDSSGSFTFELKDFSAPSAKVGNA